MRAQSLTQVHNKIFKSIVGKVGFEMRSWECCTAPLSNTQPQLNVDFIDFKVFISLFGDTQAAHTVQENMGKRIQALTVFLHQT